MLQLLDRLERFSPLSSSRVEQSCVVGQQRAILPLAFDPRQFWRRLVEAPVLNVDTDLPAGSKCRERLIGLLQQIECPHVVSFEVISQARVLSDLGGKRVELTTLQKLFKTFIETSLPDQRD